jgi:hypothetical protein
MSGSAHRRGVSLVVFAALLAMVAGPVAHSRTLTPMKCVVKGKYWVDPPEPPDNWRVNSLIRETFSEVAAGSCIGGPDGAYELSLSGDGGRYLALSYGEDVDPEDHWFMTVHLLLRSTATGAKSGRKQQWLGEAVVADTTFAVTQLKDLDIPFVPSTPKSVGAGYTRHRGTCGDLCEFVTVNFAFTW